MDADDLVVDRPVASTLLVAGVATVAYVALQVVLDGVVAPLETGIFVVVFTAVYVGGNWLLRTRARDGGELGADDPREE